MKRKNHHVNDFLFPTNLCHIILPNCNHLAFLNFFLLYLLLINLKTSAIYSCWGHLLLCVNPKCIFQASRATVCYRRDPVPFLSADPAPTTVWHPGCPPSVFDEWMNKTMYSYISGKGMVCVCSHYTLTRSYEMQIRMFPPQLWALTQSPLVPFVSKQQGI